jgi:hypothetical protein
VEFHCIQLVNRIVQKGFPDVLFTQRKHGTILAATLITACLAYRWIVYLGAHAMECRWNTGSSIGSPRVISVYLSLVHVCRIIYSMKS